MLTVQRVSCIALILAVTGHALAAPAGERPPIGVFTALALDTPPTLDGKLAPGEWDRAFATSGVIAAFDHQLMNTDTTFALGYAGDRLYLMAQCRRAPGEWRLGKAVRFNDDYDFGDPSVEIWLGPPKPVAETYQNIINTYPAVLDNHQIPSRGYAAAGWRGNWTIGVTENEDGYIIEASIPVADVGVESIRDGDLWRILAARTASGASPRAQGSWSITQGFAEIAQHPRVIFRDKGVAVQVRNVHSLLAGHYDIGIGLAAVGEAANVSIEQRFHGAPTPGGESDIVSTQTVALKSGAARALQLTGEVPARFTATVTETQLIDGKRQGVKVDRPKGFFSLTVTDDSGDVIFSQTFPYVANGWTWSRPVPPPDAPAPPPLATSVRYGPETHSVMLRADILNLAQRDHVDSAIVRVLDPDDEDAPLITATLPSFSEYYASLFLSLDGVAAPTWDHRADDAVAAEVKDALNANKAAKAAAAEARKTYEAKLKRWQDVQAIDPAKAGDRPVEPPPFEPGEVPTLPAGPTPRTVVIETTVLDAAGQVLATQRQDLSLLRHRFSWQDNEIGITEGVIPPWTPVRVGDDGFAVWNRKLKIDGLGCAADIDNGGASQIRSMRLVAVVDGKPVPVVAGAARIGRTTPAAAEFTGEGHAAALQLTALNRIEFDGFVLTDLTIAPRGESARVDEVYWELVMPESEATHFCVTAGGWSAIHDQTPSRWSSQSTGSGMLIGDFVPYIWLTNSDRAILWFADNDKGWITEPDRAVPTQEIIRADGLVTLRVRLIEVPTTLHEATTMRYGWMAFPSRPLPPGFRSVIVSQSRENYPSARTTHFWFDGDWAVLWPYYSSPFPWSMSRSKELFDQSAAARGPTHHPMVGSIAHSIGRYQDYEGRTFGDFSVDWGDTPGHIGNSDITQSRGPIDFRLWHYQRWVREAGFKGLYVDENYLSFDRNPLTGGAYIKPDGRVQPGYSYIGLRDYFRRMITMFHDNDVPRPNLWQHTTGGAAYHSWFGDILMEGENVEPTNEEFDYIEVLPASRMRAIGSPQVLGGTSIMMCQSQRHPTPWADKHNHQFVGWVMAHDILPENVKWYGPIAQAARMHHDDVRFTGYWKPDSPVRTSTDDCIVSLHRTDDRALLWVVNTSREDRTADVSVDWEKLGLDRDKVAALNVETGESFAVADAGLTVPVLHRDFTAVLLVERRALAADQRFLATFEHGTATADQAIGSEVLTGQSRVVAESDGNALQLGDKGVELWGHLNLGETAGRLSFRAMLTAEQGPIVRGSTLAAADQAAARAWIIERRKDRSGSQIVLRELSPVTDGEADTPAATTATMQLTEGWHTFDLRWHDGRLSLAIDGQDAGSIGLGTMTAAPASPSTPGTGPAVLNAPRLQFGGPRGAISMIDDLVVWDTPSSDAESPRRPH